MTADDLAARTANLAIDGTADARGGGSGLRTLWWRLLLKPHGDALCTPGAAFWIFSARIAIFVMAAAEAISWSYLGYYIGQSSQPYVTAALAGLAIFSVIWIVDASFITLDTTRSADEASILGRTTSSHHDKLKLAGGLLIRGAIISATLFISAPFLAQLVFFRDISAEMQRRDAGLIAQKRAEVASSFDARTAALVESRRALDAESIREAAGAGPSRRIGRGPVVATIEKRLAEIDGQLAAVQNEKAAALADFDALDRAGLQRQYGLAFAEDGIRTRGEILEALRVDQTYANAELAIRGFLAFLFLALIVLKLFQPASVGVYFSETLQDLHAQYRGGSFDSWLPPEERSYARVGLTPLRFKTWCIENYGTIRVEEEQQRRLTRSLAIRAAREMELRAMQQKAEADAMPLRAEARQAASALAQLENEIAAAERELEASRTELATHERKLAALSDTLRRDLGPDAFVRIADAQASVEREAEQAHTSIRTQETALARLVAESEQQRAALGEVMARLDAREAVVRTVSEQVTQLTCETSSAIAAEPARPALPA